MRDTEYFGGAMSTVSEAGLGQYEERAGVSGAPVAAFFAATRRLDVVAVWNGESTRSVGLASRRCTYGTSSVGDGVQVGGRNVERRWTHIRGSMILLARRYQGICLRLHEWS